MVDERDGAIADPQTDLETALIDEFLRARGTDRQKLRQMPESEALQLGREAAAYATARLTEVESRAHFVHEIHGTATPKRTERWRT